MNIKFDLTFKSKQVGTELDYIHKATERQDIYFIVNRFARKSINDFTYRYLTDLPDRYEQVECTFRVSGKVPQLWNPLNGEIKDVLTYREENGHTIIPLYFEPEGSVFVIFNDMPKQKHIVSIRKNDEQWFPGNRFETKEFPLINIYREGKGLYASVFEPGNYQLKWSDGREEKFIADKPFTDIELKGNWTLSFDPQWGGPEKTKIKELKSWIKFEDPGIKYYSGTASYLKTFSLSKQDLENKTIILDLGNVQEMSSVKINGHDSGLLWSAPFRYDITKYVKEGKNKLVIGVINMWPNRLIGDGKLPESKRFTKTNIDMFDDPDAEKQYLRESGLLTPVRISIFNKYEL
jgi:hypothetical protein